MKYDVRTGSYYELNNPSKFGYTADYIDTKDKKLHSIGSHYDTEREAIKVAKKFIERNGEKGDRILSLGGGNYHYTGKNWRVDHPNN